jgi:cytochrome c553
MSRLTITLTAAAASAMVAAATVALPAIGDDSGSSGSDGTSAFAACLRSHGLDGAPSTAEQLKPWLAAKEASDPRAVKAAMNACEQQLPKPKRSERLDVQKLAACLRSHGLDAPSDPDALKAWFQRMEADDPDALKRAVPDCKMKLAPPGGEAKKPGACGEEGPKVGDDAPKPAEPAEPTT